MIRAADIRDTSRQSEKTLAAIHEVERLKRDKQTLRDALANPERVARLFHDAYERLAPEFDYRTREASAVPWDEVPEANRKLMVAVATAVCASLSGSQFADTKETP